MFKTLIFAGLAFGLGACSPEVWNYPIGPVMDDDYYRARAARLDYELDQIKSDQRRLEYKLRRQQNH